MKKRLIAFAVTCALFLCVVATTSAATCLAESNDDKIIVQESRSPLRASSRTLAACYSTAFDESATGRSYNLALAASNFCCLRVGAGERLSFNQIVGVRTEERGYKRAKVIENGEYVWGVGGGVCQVSTTLYNAWIRAGLAVESVRAHSLPSSYCDLSQDATVSDYVDLVLVNDGDSAVFVDAEIDCGKLTFKIYGKKEVGISYEFKSEIEAVVEPPQDVIEFVPYLGGKEYETVRQARQGYKSHLLRLTYKDGALVDKRVLRRDAYLPVPAKILVAESIE